jgi:uncharacterized Rossmann fold enzyme
MKTYLAIKLIDGEVIARVFTERLTPKIIADISMADCDMAPDKIYLIANDGTLILLDIHGTWHDGKNPLYIKVVNPIIQEIEFDGYGVDH